MPGGGDVWTAWAGGEKGPGRERRFGTQNIYDVAGRLRVFQRNKKNEESRAAPPNGYYMSGRPATLLRECAWEQEGQAVSLGHNGRRDYSGSDFVYFYLLSESNALRGITVVDAAGRVVRVNKGDSDYQKHVICRWPINSAHVRWLP